MFRVNVHKLKNGHIAIRILSNHIFILYNLKIVFKIFQYLDCLKPNDNNQVMYVYGSFFFLNTYNLHIVFSHLQIH